MTPTWPTEWQRSGSRSPPSLTNSFLLLRMGRDHEFPVLSGSALVGDDRESQPYQLTSAVRACLSAAVDHLHAAKVLAYDSGHLHLAAPTTLARGVITRRHRAVDTDSGSA